MCKILLDSPTINKIRVMILQRDNLTTKSLNRGKVHSATKMRTNSSKHLGSNWSSRENLKKQKSI